MKVSKPVLLTTALLVAPLGVAHAERSGRIQGRVTAVAGGGVAAVKVAVRELARTRLTKADGGFAFEKVPPGSYSLSFTLGDHSAQESVEVEAGVTTEVNRRVDWPLGFADSITVVAASRRAERIVEAPAAVTTVLPEEIGRQAAHGQLPRLLEFTPGVELTQNGLFDFNLNARGFNSSLNRRILMLIDGRDPSIPLLGSQSWPAVSVPLDDLASLDLVRGPASALYGTDAYNGVLNLTTKAPRGSLGGTLRLTGGQLATRRADLRFAGELGERSYFKLFGSYYESEDFSRSRVTGAEYEGLPLEIIPVDQERDFIHSIGARFDRYFGGGETLLTVEGGNARYGGPTAVTTGGRVQVVDSRHPWARLNLNTRGWNLLASYTAREVEDQISLNTGDRPLLDSYRLHLELQGDAGFHRDRGRLVGGASYRKTTVDSANAEGVQTVLLRKTSEERSAIFFQLDYSLNDRLKGVVALRWDDSELHEDRLSPKAALVWAPRTNHSLRLTYNEAFQSPNLAEYLVRFQLLPPLDLSALEGALSPLLGGVELGLGSVPFLAVGNEGLRVEEVTAWELGYRGIPQRDLLINIDLYSSELENFVSTLLPQLGTSFGRLNPDFGAYSPPSALPPEVAGIVVATLGAVLPPELVAVLSNEADGSPVFALLSFTNVGRVDARGLEIGLQHRASRRFGWDLSYSLLDIDVEVEAAENPIVPNAPDSQLKLGFTYLGERLDVALHGRWVEGFEWRGGVFVGPVPSYSVTDLNANFSVSPRWRVGLDVSNLLDERHYEIFGGDLLERRALAHATYTW